MAVCLPGYYPTHSYQPERPNHVPPAHTVSPHPNSN